MLFLIGPKRWESKRQKEVTKYFKLLYTVTNLENFYVVTFGNG